MKGGFVLGFLILSSVLGVVVGWWRPGVPLLWILRRFLLLLLTPMFAADSHVHLLVADVTKSFDTVDRGILDRVLCSVGLPGWFRHAYFEYHARVRLRFKLASGLGEPWARDGGIPQGCPLSMMFIVALYLPWCWYLAAHEGVQPQLYADNLKCVSGDPDLLLSTARFTTGYVRLVGQEPAPSECGHGPVHPEIGFQSDLDALAWSRPGLPLLGNLAGPLQHFKAAILDAWRKKVK